MPKISRFPSALRLFCLSLLMVFAASPMWATGSTTLVISQVYGGGGSTSSSAAYNVDYIEILNVSGAPIDVSGYAVQYGSATLKSGPTTSTFTIPAGTTPLASGHYFLIAGGNSTGYAGASITNADYTPATVTLAAGGGKVFLVSPANAGTPLVMDASGCPAAGVAIDFVGYGTALCGEGGTIAPTPSASSSVVRNGNGCTDTDNNAADFTLSTTPMPRNTSSTPAACVAAAPVPLSATAAFVTNPVNTGTSTLLTATVTPSNNPVSTGITVTADLSAFGVTAPTTLHDDGLNGDVTAGDHIYSYSLGVPANQTTKAYTVTLTVKDQTSTVTPSPTASLTVQTPPPAATTLALTDSSNSIVVGSGVTFTVVASGNETAKPTGTVTFYDNTNTMLGVGTVTTPGTWTFSTSTLALGSHTITATYGGDGVYPSNTTTVPANVVVAVTAVPTPDFNFSLSNSTILLNGDTHQGSTTVNVAFVVGYNSPVTFACSGLPSGSRCIFNPSTLTASGSSVLTVGIDGANMKPMSPFGKSERMLAALGLLGLPLLMRRRKKLAGIVLGLLMLGVAATSLTGCAGGNSTPTGTSTITVTGTGDGMTHTSAITLNVQP